MAVHLIRVAATGGCPSMNGVDGVNPGQIGRLEPVMGSSEIVHGGLIQGTAAGRQCSHQPSNSLMGRTERNPSLHQHLG